MFTSHAAETSLIVNTGFELHAALASPDISLVYVARNVSMCQKKFPRTTISSGSSSSSLFLCSSLAVMRVFTGV